MKSVMNYEMVENKEINIIDFFKFVMLSGFGLAMFIFPIKWNDSFSTGINIFTEIIEKVMGDASPWIVLIIMCSSTFGTLITILLKPKFIMKNKGLKELFDSSPLNATITAINIPINSDNKLYISSPLSIFF